MDVFRIGAVNNSHGSTALISGFRVKKESALRYPDDVATWRGGNASLDVPVPYVEDPHDPGKHHNYTIRLTLSDICTLLSLIAEETSGDDATAIQHHFEKHIPTLVKLLSCATGLSQLRF